MMDDSLLSPQRERIVGARRVSSRLTIRAGEASSLLDLGRLIPVCQLVRFDSGSVDS
jgi:hypothetical protein